MSKSRRLRIIVAFWTVVLVGSGALLALSHRQVSTRLDAIRARAATATVTDADVLAAMVSQSSADRDAVARHLGVDPVDLVISQTDGRWCLSINVRRLLANGQLAYRTDPEGHLHKVTSCG
jgi:hypothetical protein